MEKTLTAQKKNPTRHQSAQRVSRQVTDEEMQFPAHMGRDADSEQ